MCRPALLRAICITALEWIEPNSEMCCTTHSKWLTICSWIEVSYKIYVLIQELISLVFCHVLIIMRQWFIVNIKFWWIVISVSYTNDYVFSIPSLRWRQRWICQYGGVGSWVICISKGNSRWADPVWVVYLLPEAVDGMGACSDYTLCVSHLPYLTLWGNIFTECASKISSPYTLEDLWVQIQISPSFFMHI